MVHSKGIGSFTNSTSAQHFYQCTTLHLLRRPGSLWAIKPIKLWKFLFYQHVKLAAWLIKFPRLIMQWMTSSVAIGITSKRAINPLYVQRPLYITSPPRAAYFLAIIVTTPLNTCAPFKTCCSSPFKTVQLFFVVRTSRCRQSASKRENANNGGSG